jgi:hypothetical protein
LLALLPLHILLLGFPIALVHSIFGLLAAIPLLDGLFLAYRQFPFACSYVPIQNPKLLWPSGLVALLLVTYGIANVERWALAMPIRTAGLAIALGAIALLIKVLDRMNRRERLPVNFDERPAFATQRLGLFDRVANPD